MGSAWWLQSLLGFRVFERTLRVLLLESRRLGKNVPVGAAKRNHRNAPNHNSAAPRASVDERFQIRGAAVLLHRYAQISEQLKVALNSGNQLYIAVRSDYRLEYTDLESP